MKCQILFYGKCKKNNSNGRLLKVYPECLAIMNSYLVTVKVNNAKQLHSRSLIRIFTGCILDSQECKVYSCRQRKL